MLASSRSEIGVGDAAAIDTFTSALALSTLSSIRQPPASTSRLKSPSIRLQVSGRRRAVRPETVTISAGRTHAAFDDLCHVPLEQQLLAKICAGGGRIAAASIGLPCIHP